VLQVGGTAVQLLRLQLERKSSSDLSSGTFFSSQPCQQDGLSGLSMEHSSLAPA
jgi:hypothetical protein